MAEKEIEQVFNFSKQELYSFLEDFSKSVKDGKVKIKNEVVNLPDNMEVEYGFKIEDGQNEIELEIKWKK